MLSTARDILFLWVARMVMLGLRFTGEIPFADVYIHSVIQAPDGRRMSKSLGTGVDPLALIDGGPRPAAFAQGGDFPAYGADAVRFGLLAMSSSQDVRFSEEKIAQGQALVNKLFNATRFALLQIGDEDIAPEPRPRTVEDRWILSRLDAAKDDDADAHRRLRLRQGGARALRLHLRGPLRLVPRDGQAAPVRGGRPGGRADLAATLRHVLRETLMLAHPIIPFVTEELWGMLGEDGLLAATLAPAAGGSSRDPEAEEQVGRAIAAVTALRGWRDRCEVRPGAVVPIRLPDAGYEATGATSPASRASSWRGNGTEPVAGIAVPGGTIGVLPSPDVDLGAAERRLEARRAELRGEIERAERKLANEGFVAKAPAAGGGRRARQARSLQGRARGALGRDATARVVRPGRGGLAPRARAARDALRAAPDAPPDGRARRPAGALPAVHVVGTNGKSSTTRMTAAILARHGLRTGAYLSPHLVSFTERILLGGADIGDDVFAEACARVKAEADALDADAEADDRVTQFEALTAAAFLALADEGVDVAVVEAGLGGRWTPRTS